ncbi:S9 family peptidase [Leucobacter zeae]|nr:S9 family peptidase [Leucobacter zeae]
MSIDYPITRTGDDASAPAGVRIADPYRWLEADTAEVREWQLRQGELASRIIGAGGRLAEARAFVAAYDDGARPDLPLPAAGLWFWAEPDARGVAIRVADEPYGPGRELVHLAEFADADPGAPTPTLSWLAPAPDGTLLALGVCTDGSEHHRIRLLDVRTGEVRSDAPSQTLHSAWAGGVSWWPDSRGFSFFALTGRPEDFVQAVFAHRIGGGTSVEAVPIPEGSREYTRLQYGVDGRWAVASHRLGSPSPVAVRDADGGRGWRPFVTGLPLGPGGTVAGHIVGDAYVAVTDVGAPRGRIVSIPLAAERPEDPATWTELVPESDVVLRAVTPVGDRLYVHGFDRTVAFVRILDATGRAVPGEPDRVPLPGKGAIGAPFFALTALAASPPADARDGFVFAFSTLTTSWGVYRHRPGAAELETLRAPGIELDARVELHSARAADGTAIPFHVVRPAGADPATPAPVLISAYGAANVPLLPQYQGDLAACVAAGGTIVQAYLRGGGELGSGWFRGAHRERRHVRDGDLVAVAEHLVASGIADADRLALTGGSDGGLMCGVAVTTRPDLWRAVLPRAPLLDLIGGIRDPYLEFVIRKAWGDPDIAEDVRRLAANSPYELIRPGRYPAVYVQAGDTDPRCPPWQARKFAARLQAAQRGDAPILLHVFENAGHGAATSPEVLAQQDAEWLAVLLGELGLGSAEGRDPRR